MLSNMSCLNIPFNRFPKSKKIIFLDLKILAHQAQLQKIKCLASNDDPPKLYWKSSQGWIVFRPKYMLVSYVSKNTIPKYPNSLSIEFNKRGGKQIFLSCFCDLRLGLECEKFSNFSLNNRRPKHHVFIARKNLNQQLIYLHNSPST